MNTTANLLIARLRSMGVEIFLKGDELDISGRKSSLTQDLLSEVRASKSEIIEILRNRNQTLKKVAQKSYEYPNGRIVEVTEDEFDEIVDFFADFLKLLYQI